jgi:cell division protein FtsI (penicillin-binding protein 3)
MNDKRKSVLIRVYSVYTLMLLFGLAIMVQVWRLQFIEGDELRAQADSLTTRLMPIEASRGNIYSADGSLLATSVPIYDVRVDMLSTGLADGEFERNVDSLSICLSKLFGDRPPQSYKESLRRARHHGNRYFLLKRNISYSQMVQLKTFPLFRKGRYQGGLIIETKNRREKPFKLLASRTIGYSKNGLNIGIEGAFNEHLQGTDGLRLMQRIAGNKWKPVSDENQIDPSDGNDAVTTIDVNIQDVAENSLYTQLSRHNAEKGCAILMEVATGEIRAIANLQKGDNGNYYEDYNFAIGESTEPGSTFKLATLMALIEDGYADLDDMVDTQGGKIRYANRIMRDSHHGGYGEITLQEVFEVSSNVGISKQVVKYYSKDPQKFVDRIRSFGLGAKHHIQLLGEKEPIIRNTDHRLWSKVSLPYLSIGYESSFTPLQVLNLYNTVANNGTMVKPFFVKEIRNKGQLVKKFEPEIIIDSIASLSTIKLAQKALEGVVENGTAQILRHAQYKIAGKTGTAQIAYNKGGYKVDKVRYQASFVGYFPADDPKYSCIVVVYAPNNNLYYASQVAAPIFKEIADKVYSTSIDMHKNIDSEQLLALNTPYVKGGDFYSTSKVLEKLGVPYEISSGEYNYVRTRQDSGMVRMQGVHMRHDQVPDVSGMGLKDALIILESHGLRVRASGRGKVRKQSISAGSKYQKGEEITIYLS